jgi:serine/threonine-protein kinase
LVRETGATVGDYRLIRRIGSGASGEVFEAEHVLTRRVEAVKFLARGVAADSEAERNLLREIEIQASLQHPNIAAVHNAFRTPEGLALVMELVDGAPLDRRLERGRIPLREGARYVSQTLDALAYAHQHRVVHRDVKPANIVVTGDGSIKLTDFGLARTVDDGQGGHGTLAGSPYYIAPEQVLGLAPPDARSDCYSVGVILYEIAAGRRPFEGESAFDVMLQHREAIPVPPIRWAPAIGPALNAVILRALEKEPDRRFQSAREFRTALESALVHPLRKGRWMAAALVVGMVATAAMLAPVSRPPVPPPLPPRPAIPPAPIVTVPSVEPPPPVVEQKPARKTIASAGRRRQPVETSTVPTIIETEPAAETPPERVPVAPPVATEPVPEPPLVTPPRAVAVELPDAAPAPPAKRPGALRRAFGKIVRTLSGKPKPDPQ